MNYEKLIPVINDLMQNTMVDHLNIEFTSMNDQMICAKMPVTDKCRQPYGVLHGGASAALAETVASTGSHYLVSSENKKAFGVEIIAQHLKSVDSGTIFAKALLIKKGRSLHTWQVEITNESDELICISKMIVAIK